VEVDRADRRHRLELGERREHTVRLAERRGGERAQVCEPLAPPRLARERVEPLDEREREAAEVREVRELPRERLRARLGLVVAQRLPAKAELLFEAVQAVLPALLPADHRRLDE